jgi:hypothetical protein
MWKYIASLWLLFPILLMAQEQDQPQDSVTSFKRPKLKPDFRPSAIRFGTDLYSIGNTIIENGERTFEVQGDIDFHKYLATLELGIQDTDLLGSNFEYSGTGSYYRVGIDINLTQFNPDRHVIFLGMRYARSRFQERLKYDASDSVWQDVQLEESHEGMSSRWLEITGGMKVRVWQNLAVGYIIRYKIFRKINGVPELDNYIVPGYGLARKNTNLGFGFYLHYRLAFRYKPVPIKP